MYEESKIWRENWLDFSFFLQISLSTKYKTSSNMIVEVELLNKTLSKSLFAPEYDGINLCFCHFLSHLVLKHRGNWVEKGNDKDLFDTFIQKMAKKDLNDIGVISINLEMIYNGLPQYITLIQILIFIYVKDSSKWQNNSLRCSVNVLLQWSLYATS